MINKQEYLKRGQLNRMAKYFKNKKILMRFEYNNSLGWHQVREYKGKYDNFLITEHTMGSYKDFEIKFYKDENVIFEESFSHWSEFTGLGKIQYNNSGPYCYFSVVLI